MGKVVGPVLGAVAGTILGGPVGGAIGAGLGGAGGAEVDKALTPRDKSPSQAPITMPLADDDAVKRAKRRSISAQMGRGGRTSTMLTGETDTLGG